MSNVVGSEEIADHFQQMNTSKSNSKKELNTTLEKEIAFSVTPMTKKES